jgi:hypothetical protein
VKDETRAILERVVEKAARIERSGFMAYLARHPIRLEVGRLSMKLHRPDDDARDALLLTLRFFTQRNEPTSFQRLEKLVDPGLSASWHSRFKAINRSVNRSLGATIGTIRTRDKVYSPSNREVLETFLYGGLAHANKPAAVARYREWAQVPNFHSFLEFRFMEAIRRVLVHIRLLSELCEAELAERAG